MKKPVQIFPTSMRTYSDVGYSREPASYYVGRPDTPTSSFYALSEREAKELVTNLPEELLEVVKEHYDLMPANSIKHEAQSVIPDVSSQILEKVEEELQDGVLGVKQYEAIKSEFIQEPESDDEVDIYNMNINQLRQIASQLEIKGYTKYSKAELLAKIEEIAETSDD